MKRRILLGSIALLSALVFAACVAPVAAPQPAAEAEPTEAAVEEAMADEAEAPAGDPATYAVDAAASEVVWTGSNIVGQEQVGTVDISDGTLDFVGTTLSGGSITLDMTTLASTSMGGDQAQNLIGHLSNEDFFEVNTWPTSVLALKSAEPTDVADQYLVTADLTIKDVTDELTFVTDVAVGDGELTATADIEFDRTQWGIIFGSGSFFDGLGDRVINDEVTLAVTLVASAGE